MNAHVEPFCESDFVLGFVRLPFFLLLWTPHQETPGRYPGKLHPETVRDLVGLAVLFRWVFSVGLGESGESGCQEDGKCKADEASHGLLSRFWHGFVVRSEERRVGKEC